MEITDRIILREFREEDLERMHAWVNDSKITKNLSFAIFPRTLNDSRNFLDMQLQRRDDSYINFVISEKDDKEQKYIGSVGLKNIDYINRKAEFSIAIGFMEYMGKGYGTEATKLIVKYAFNRLGLNKVYLKVLGFNKNAVGCYEKAGFKLAGELKQDIFYDGKYYSQYYMEILKEDWNKN